MTSPGSSRTAARPIAGRRATHRARLRAWWRGPALRRLTRRQASLALVLVGVLSLALGGGAAAVVKSVVSAPDEAERTALGPVQIHLPDDIGPWTTVPGSSFDDLRAGGAPGGTMIDSAWGVVAPGPVVVTVFSAAAGSHGGLDSVAATIPRDEGVTWSGRAAHAVGAEVTDGVRDLMLAVETSDGDLVILSVSAPVAAFDSGTLQESFRTARVGD